MPAVYALSSLLSPAPLRTVLALFTHTAPHMVNSQRSLTWPSLLCDAISFPPVPRFCERPVLPHAALPCVASFPPAALPAFIGTTKLSDSLCLICLPPSSVVRHTLDCSERGTGSPGLPCNPDVRHAMVSDPGEAAINLPLALMSVLTSTS